MKQQARWEYLTYSKKTHTAYYSHQPKFLEQLTQTHAGDFTNREIDTRTKKRTTGEDIENIDKVIDELMKQNMINPSENPFSYLWLANCHLFSRIVIYSVVVAFL